MVTGKITAVCGVPGSAFPAVKPGVPQVVAYVGAPGPEGSTTKSAS